MATKTRKKKSIADLNAEVTERIIESIKDSGLAPWQRPWKVIGAHKNWTSKKSYRGINQFLLDLTAQADGYTSPYWLTFNQAAQESYKQWRKAEGLTVTLGKDWKKTDEYKRYRESDSYKGVKEGEKGTYVYLFRPFNVKKTENGKPGGTPVLDKDGNEVWLRLFDIRYFKVFNAEQTNLNLPQPSKDDEREHTPIEAAQEVIDDYEGAPDIIHSGDRACYIPSLDQIKVPKPEQFKSDEHYYVTLFHECVHSTGAKKRTGRIKDWTSFGSDPYAKEELVAELGAAILSSYTEIDPPEVQEQNAAYIKSWIKRFEDDKGLLLSAGAQAQTAVDHILGTTFDDEEGK